MGWETRKGAGHYYTRSRKVHGRVIREYIGGGIVGEIAAEMDAQDAAERQMTALAWQRERARLQTRDAAIVRYCRDVDELVRAALTAAGYHQHKRGEWRRRRDQDSRQG